MKENDEWYTPAGIIRSLGEFDLDPCTSIEAYNINHSAKKYYTAIDDGLSNEWFGRVWLNPPYSYPLIKDFMVKMAVHNHGMALIFPKVESKWLQDTVLESATAVKFLYNRIKFIKRDGSIGGQPRNCSMLIAYGESDADILRRNELKGKFIRL